MYIMVRVNAGAKIERITKKSEDHFDIAVKEKAQRNMANRKVVELIAREYKTRIGKVRIVSGHHTAGKILSVDPVDATSSGRSPKNSPIDAGTKIDARIKK